MNALFCGNFGMARGGRFEVCRRAWCGACYVSHPLDKFHIQAPVDEEGFSWLVNDDDRFRFRQARNGDRLMTPFQCDWCLFRLLTGGAPRASGMMTFSSMFCDVPTWMHSGDGSQALCWQIDEIWINSYESGTIF
jgi:hypothetical protein